MDMPERNMVNLTITMTREESMALKQLALDAQFAAENLSLNRCMPIILLRGAKAEKQHRIIARCFAATAI